MTKPPVAIVPPDVSIRNEAGEVLLFSWPEFVETICEGTSCFVCGRPRAGNAFNDEHIVPNWVLHAFDLHKKAITLPNGRQTVYGNYTIPCCAHCNTEMAREFEDVISPLVRAGGDAVQNHVAGGGGQHLFTWMALIFLKLHLNDRRLRKHRNFNDGDAPISVDYTWEHMHHLHAVARAFHIGATLMPEATGSLYVFPIDAGERDFDLLTITDAQTLYLQLGRTGIIAVFDDAHAALNRVMWIIEKINGPLSSFQARELAIHFAMANLDLVNRPRFWTQVSPDKKDVLIGGATESKPLFRPYDQALFGHLMTVAFPVLPEVAGLDRDQAAALLASGDMNFLLDDKLEFVSDHARKSGFKADVGGSEASHTSDQSFP
ncbi:hypothetical protein E5554_18835 [Sphingobium sp. PAMC28499]|uniref:hypothetical protein n=1 Tax=Sphingobium sp. PAMC28499 TaxID=2565554 RepID=UPI00109DAA5B|nr:hypothetical protein [Sphingobium sp. PAMC28499]QCB39698.1 hypothetical protein E5554_18835 [Sphingobium sp. PAMC28499]